MSKCELLTASKGSQFHRKLLLANSVVRYQTGPLKINFRFQVVRLDF